MEFGEGAEILFALEGESFRLQGDREACGTSGYLLSGEYDGALSDGVTRMSGPSARSRPCTHTARRWSGA